MAAALNKETFCSKCGGIWFEIIDDEVADTGGAVTIDDKGVVLVRSGALRCWDCEEPFVPNAVSEDLQRELQRILESVAGAGSEQE